MGVWSTLRYATAWAPPGNCTPRSCGVHMELMVAFTMRPPRDTMVSVCGCPLRKRLLWTQKPQLRRGG